MKPGTTINSQTGPNQGRLIPSTTNAYSDATSVVRKLSNGETSEIYGYNDNQSDYQNSYPQANAYLHG